MTLVGSQVGRYRIVELLGQGGMSVVYKAHDTALDREVAVKVLHPHLAQRPESRKRLEREAKAVARLKHPNILEVYDSANEASGEAYIVTELIKGRTLRELVAAEPLQPPELAALVVHELAAALAHAHDAGVLHRDLKPDNVMVRDDGVLKLMDFGIAKILDRDERMTVTGALVGSPAHMAPEIIEGEEAGAEADVFSLGTMLYLFATGKLPFTAPNTTATLKRILDGVYDDPRQLVPTVSDELADVIARCLQRNPADRYPSAAALREALERLLADLGLRRPQEELSAFFLDPKGYRKALVPRLTGALLARAEALVAEKRSARALSALNLVLAHDPSNARAAELLGQMQARRQKEKQGKARRRALGVAVAGACALAAGGLTVERATRPPDFTYRPPFQPWELTLAAVAWPPTPAAQPASTEPAPAVPATAVVAVAPSQVAGRVSAPVKSLPRGPEPVEVVVVVRPFGYLQVDKQPRSKDALSRHTLRLVPGKHRFVVSCEYCEAGERPVEWVVAPGEEVPLVAPLKPSLVSFAGFPPEAKVKVGNEERTVAQALKDPFRVAMPTGGSTSMRHQVDYVVTLDGAELGRGRRQVTPGEAVVIEKGTK